MEYSFYAILKELNKASTYMMIGNGSKNQFRYKRDMENTIQQIQKQIPLKSNLLYFGDSPNPKKPDIGLMFQLLHEKRPDIQIYMIQISEAKSWGVPSFVKGVYWHSDFTKQCKWGGVNLQGEPCSNTKKWLNLHKKMKGNGIHTMFVVGGGPITLQEAELAFKHDIPTKYYPIERKYKGDGVTKVTQEDTLTTRIGPSKSFFTNQS